MQDFRSVPANVAGHFFIIEKNQVFVHTKGTKPEKDNGLYREADGAIINICKSVTSAILS